MAIGRLLVLVQLVAHNMKELIRYFSEIKAIKPIINDVIFIQILKDIKK